MHTYIYMYIANYAIQIVTCSGKTFHVRTSRNIMLKHPATYSCRLILEAIKH